MADDRRHLHQGASACFRSQGRQPGHGRDQEGLNSKLHLAADENGMSVRLLVTPGTDADCTHAGTLIEGLTADHLIADKGYDSDAIIGQAMGQGMQVQIPARKHRNTPRPHDKHLYRLRHRIENAFLHLKRWRGIATRHAKRSASFLAAVQIRCITLWAAIL